MHVGTEKIQKPLGIKKSFITLPWSCTFKHLNAFTSHPAHTSLQTCSPFRSCSMLLLLFPLDPIWQSCCSFAHILSHHVDILQIDGGQSRVRIRLCAGGDEETNSGAKVCVTNRDTCPAYTITADIVS